MLTLYLIESPINTIRTLSNIINVDVLCRTSIRVLYVVLKYSKTVLILLTFSVVTPTVSRLQLSQAIPTFLPSTVLCCQTTGLPSATMGAISPLRAFMMPPHQVSLGLSRK